MVLNLLRDFLYDFYFKLLPPQNVIGHVGVSAHQTMSPSSLEVQKATNREIAKFIAWSMKWASAGLGPETGYYNEEFGKDTYRAGLAGKALALGWRILK